MDSNEIPSGLADELEPEEMEDVYARAVRNTRIKVSLYIHATVFVAVMVLLLIVNLATWSGSLWVLWPLGGWGLGLGVHWFAITKLVGMYDSLKEREIVRQLEMRQRT